MTSSEQPLLPLISTAELQRWRVERDRLESVIAKLHGQKEAIDRLIAAAEKLVDTTEAGALHHPIAAAKTEFPKPKLGVRSSGGRKKPRLLSWTGTILSILDRYDRGASYDQLKEEIGKTRLAGRLAQSDKGFYGGVAKVADRNELVKHKGWLFSRGNFDRLQRAIRDGREDDVEELVTPARGSPMGNEVLRVVRSAHPRGVPTSEVIERLREHPDFGASVRKNATAGYNVLARMVKRGELLKDENKILRLPQDENEPRAREGGGSDTEGDATAESSPSLLD